MNLSIPASILAASRAAFVDAHTHTATVLRRSSANGSIRGGEGGPFAALATEVTGRLRHTQGEEVAAGGKRVAVEKLEYLCAVGSDITTADRLLIDGVTYEVADVDTGRADQLTMVVTLRK